MDDLSTLGLVLGDDDWMRQLAQDAAAQRRLWNLAVHHWVHLCLAWRLTSAAGESWGAGVRSEARAMLADASVLEELQRRELAAVMAALASAGVPNLLLKGAAWAYQVYPQPILRSRDDTDLFICAADRETLADALAGIGYEPATENTAEPATAQRHFHRVDTHGFVHSIDVHWRVTNPLVFADALPFSRAWPRSVSIAGLDGARALCLVDALQLACLHRLAHHGDDSNLIWVYDIHWIATRLPANGWDELVQESETNRLSAVCLRGLSRSVETFGTRVPAGALSALAAAARPGDDAFFQKRVSPLNMLVSDWRTLDTWSARLRLLRAHVLPQRAYIASKYGTRNPVLLPLLYAHRALAGLPRWLSGSR